jgi:hypothetical protein
VSQKRRTTDIPLIPREVLFGNPDKAMSKVSHDGKQFAFLAPLAGVLSVWAAFDRMVTRQMLAVIGYVAPGAKYSDLFQVMGICNYPVEDFPSKSRLTASRGRYGRSTGSRSPVPAGTRSRAPSRD